MSAQFSPDSTLIVTACDGYHAETDKSDESIDTSVRVWSVYRGELLFTIEHTNQVASALFSPDGKYILTASEDQTAKIWDSLNGQLLRTLDAHTSNVFALDVTNDGQKIVTASADKSAKIWELVSGQLLGSLDDHEGVVWDAQFSPDGKFVVTIDTEGEAAKI